MSDLLNRLDSRKMPTKNVPICLDLNLLDRRDEAMADIARAARNQREEDRMVPTAALKKARAKLAAVEGEIRDASIVIMITGVDRATYNRYLLECPPRKGHQEQMDPTRFYMHVARNTGQYVDGDGVAHDMTTAEWDRIDKIITDGEHDRIAEAVLAVNRAVGGHGIDFLGDAFATITGSSETSESPAASGSRRAGSGAGSRKKSAPKTS